MDISYNRLKNLPEKLFGSVNVLKKLNLTANKLDKIDSGLFNTLKSVEILLLANNKIKDLKTESFKNLQNLKQLDLSHNKLEYLSESSFNNLNMLSTLSLTNNQISVLDEKIFHNMKNLFYLLIGSNQISVLPEKLFQNLSSLQLLDVSDNPITQLHKEAFISLKNLIKLFLVKTNITELPVIFSEQVDLKWFSLTSNKINKLNKSIFEKLINVNLLDISNNFLQEFDKDFFKNLSKLEWLNISNNQITSLDAKCFINLEKLTMLDISNNRLAAIDPSWFTDLKNLTSLDISCNNISSVNFKDFSSLIRLTTLNMFKNKLKECFFDSSININYLDLSSNQISEISFGQNKLEIIRLNNNQIKNIDLSQFQNIQEIYLNGNNLVDIKSSYNSSLKCLHIYENPFHEQKILEIENNFKNIDLKVRFLFSLNQPGYVKSIKNGNINDLSKNLEDLIKVDLETFGDISNTSAPLILGCNQFQNFFWEDIPMFSVITGVNGIGKTSLLQHIKQMLEISYRNTVDFKGIIIIPILIEEHEKTKDSFFFDQLIQEDLVYNLNKFKGSQLVDPSIRFKFRNKASIYSFKSVESCLSFLKKDIEELSSHLKKESFKYIQIKEKNNSYFLGREETNTEVNLANLSPGEKLILLLLIWQFIFNNYEVYGNTILLFDEPDAHLHPAAVHELIKILKKLVNLGIQIIFTTHSPITVNFIDDSNLFLLYEEKNQLKIRKGTTQHELSNALTSQLVNVEKPSKTLIVEGKDAEFYQTIKTILNKTEIYNIPYHFQINIISLNDELRNKSIIKQTIKAVKSFQLFYGIVDDDGDNDCGKIDYIENLFYLKRYAKENYILDPINVYFFLRNNPPKNDDLKNFVKNIQENIAKKFSKEYSDYTLNKIIELIYLNDERKNECVQLLEFIIGEFYEKMKTKAVASIIDNKTNAAHLFRLPLYFFKDQAPNLKNNFNKTSVIVKLYEDILINLRKNKNDLKEFH